MLLDLIIMLCSIRKYDIFENDYQMLPLPSGKANLTGNRCAQCPGDLINPSI